MPEPHVTVEDINAVLGACGSARDREHLLRLALALAVQELGDKNKHSTNLILDYLLMARTMLSGEPPDA